MSYRRLAIKNTGDMSSGFDSGDSPVTLFTVTGDVLIFECFAVVNVAVSATGPALRFRLGIDAGGAEDQIFVPDTEADGTDLGAPGDVWLIDGVASNPFHAIPQGENGWVLGTGEDVVLNIPSGNTDAGDMTFYARWLPLSANGNLVAA